MYRGTGGETKVPSAKVLEQKKQIVCQLTETIKNASAGVFVEYQGISVEDDTKLRNQLREAGVKYSVVKNTLVRRAADELGFSELDGILNGTTAMAVSDDLVAPAKVICEFAKKNENIKVKAGILEGKVIDAAEVEKLSKVPSKETLLCMLLYALNGNISGLARALQAIVDQKSEGAAPAEATEAAAE